MFLIFGLGNKGNEFMNTPHNAGFMFLDSFREYLGWDTLYDVSDWEFDKYFLADVCTCKVNNVVKLMLFKPTTLMNRSGLSVQKVLAKIKIDIPKSFVLIHDDLDIKLGKFKIQRARAPHGHNGVESVHNFISNRDFLRVRIGIENRKFDIPGEIYVLEKYKKEELETLNEVISDASRQLRSLLVI